MSPEPETTETRSCPTCQGAFTPTPGTRQLYCSPTCKRHASRPPRADLVAHTCPVCEGEFQADPRVRQVYCSPTCRAEQEHRRERARDQERARRLGESAPGSPGPRQPTIVPAPAPAKQPGPAGPPDPMGPTATRACPHCGQPVTIVALLTTPEAARPHITQPGADIVALRRA